MSQIKVQTPDGQPLTSAVNVRISEGQQPQEAAIYDVNTASDGSSGWPIPFWPMAEYTLYANVDGNQYNPRYSVGVPKIVQHGDDVIITLEGL